MARRGGRLVAAGVCALMLVAAGVRPASAQRSRPPGEQRVEVGVSALVAAAMSLGETAASETRPNGSPLVIFKTANRVPLSSGVEARVGYDVTPRLTVEGVSSWTPFSLQSRITGDLENADDASLQQRASRFTVEVAALWAIVHHDRLSVFVRGSGGWMREVTRGVAFVEDGEIGGAGLGVKYWYGQDAARRHGRVALRLDGRALVRSGGLSFGERALRIAPAVTAGFSIAF